MLPKISGLPPSLLGAIVGGVLTILGTISVNIYQIHRRNRNLRQVFRAEIMEAKGVTEPLMAINELLVDGEIDLNKYDVIDRKYIRKEDSETAFFLFVSAYEHARKGDFASIYHSNTSKLGDLNFAQSQIIIQFYSNAHHLYYQINDDSVLDAARQFFLDEDTGADDDDIQRIHMALMTVGGTYELQETAIQNLKYGFIDSVMLRIFGFTFRFRPRILKDKQTN
jgi:hypothetical protein